MEKLVRIGIIGSGRIARRFVPEMRCVDGLELVGVYNPHEDSAARFASETGVGFYTADEKDFFQQVDAVIVCTPHKTHYAYARQALEHGKHVLCEKPMALEEGKAEELYALAEKKGLVLLEAIKTAYVPGFQRVLDIVHAGTIGDIRDVESCFTRIFPKDDSRELTDAECGGSFTEYGSYTLLPIIKLLGTQYRQIRFACFKAANGVDLYTKAFFTYPHSLASAKTGLKVKSDGHLLISGTRGYVFVKAPWWKTSEIEICYEDYTKNETITAEYLGDGLRYELTDFMSAIREGQNSSTKLTAEESAAFAGVMEKFLAWRRATPVEDGVVSGLAERISGLPVF